MHCPKGCSKFIHDLETRCDPGGEVATNILLRDQRDALVKLLEEKKSEIEALRQELQKVSDR
jgi:hypothetical protein